MSADIETLRVELRHNRDQLDAIASEPISLGTLLDIDLRRMRRLALLDRINGEMGR